MLSILVENKPGSLARIIGLFSGRGYNIDSLCVAETTDPALSRVTMVTTADKSILEQIKKQLHKLINIVEVIDYTDRDFVSRELALIKVNAEEKVRAELLRIVDIFRCKIRYPQTKANLWPCWGCSPPWESWKSSGRVPLPWQGELLGPYNSHGLTGYGILQISTQQ